ncbi:MAG: hypothetical protein IPI03_17765 [Rubrivivax sp.]|nr:hypothetical protein [Rubrivivax sp.]
MNRRGLLPPAPRSISLLTGLVAALPLALLWPALRQTLEARMLLHMLLEFPALFASGWALQRIGLGSAWLRRLAGPLVLLDWRGWCGATLAAIVAAAWMLPSLLDLALLLPAVAATKYASWCIAGWLLAGSLRRMDPEVLLFLAGNVAWMMCSAGMLYLDAPVRLCVNYLQDDQRNSGIGLMLVALLLGVLALRQVLQPAAAEPCTPAPDRARVNG